MRWLARVSRLLARVEEAAAGFLVAGIVAVILAQIVSRRLFGRPLIWSEELCTFGFMAATMLGAAAATYRRVHIRLTLLLDRLPGRERITRATEWLLAGLFAALIPGTVAFVLAVGRLGVRAPAVGISMTWIYALVPLALFLIVLHLIAGRGAGEDD